LAGWINGDYQREKEKYFNDQFGFRNDFVRLHNQIGYSLFKKMNAKWSSGVRTVICLKAIH
jgi:hypothetical protein